MTGFMTRVAQDVPPFMMVNGSPAQASGFNIEGLKRRGYSAVRIAAVKAMHRALYRDGLKLDDAKTRIAALASSVPEAAGDVALMLQFLDAASRGIVR
jgi:UDP-N-acetylglucosamine acyltransferase